MIPFNRPFIVGKELYYIAQAVLNGHIAGDGTFTQKCHAFLENTFHTPKALLTHSCTAALEMAALLCDLQPGDEVILPSFTFVSTANAFHMRGARLVFGDIRPDTLNLDENLIEKAITPRTKAIVPVHYAGVSCEMDIIMDIAHKYRLLVVEDAAQGVSSVYKDRFLGTIGDLGAYSFHETKNCICGEGGALLVNNEQFIERAEIIREKGTNRSKFFRGEVDKYTWVDVGSSYLPSDIIAAFLYAQLENIEEINARRRVIYDYYRSGLAHLADSGVLHLPYVPYGCLCNNHLFYILLRDEAMRDALMTNLRQQNIGAVFHYLPLHLSPVGRGLGYHDQMLPVTESTCGRLLRLPLYFGITKEEQDRVIDAIDSFFQQ